MLGKLAIDLDVLSILVITIAPATVISYNILSLYGVLTPEDAREIERVWKKGIREGKLDPDDTGFDRFVSLIAEKTDREAPKGVDHLKIVEGAFGGPGIYIIFTNDRDSEKLSPLTLADKWVNDYVREKKENIKLRFYQAALICLIFGLFLELINRIV